MKKWMLLFVTAIFFAGANIVFAQEATFSTAKKIGSNDWQDTDTFTLGDKPWLHINVPDEGFLKYWTFSSWNYPPPGVPYFLSNQSCPYAEFSEKEPRDLYLAFNEATWAGIVKVGDWNISAATVLFLPSEESPFGTTLKAYDGHTAFKVTPEPVSSVLFLLGAGSLASRSLLKKKRKVI